MSYCAIVSSIARGYCNICRKDMDGTITSGFSSITIKDKLCGTSESEVTGNCGHKGKITITNNLVKCGDFYKASVGSTFEGDFEGEIISGYNLVNIGG